MTPAARRAVAAGVFVLYAVGVVALVTWPEGSVINELNVRLYVWFFGRGVPAWVTPPWYAVALNVLLLAPMTFVATLAFERVAWWRWAVMGVLASVAIEILQATLVADRVASWADVVANSLGALGGALLGWVVRRPHT